jgi:hypothetical protein
VSAFNENTVEQATLRDSLLPKLLLRELGVSEAEQLVEARA